MNTGMLWYDNDPKTALAVKIERAAAYYRQKYGCEPNVCLIHPSMVDDASFEAKKDFPETTLKTSIHGEKKVVVRLYRPVLPGHLWIGVEDKH